MKGELRRFLDLAGAQAGRAYAQPLMNSLDKGVDALEIGVPAPLGDIVGMTDPVTIYRTFSADIAGSCHPDSSHHSIIEVVNKSPILPQIRRSLPDFGSVSV